MELSHHKYNQFTQPKSTPWLVSRGWQDSLKVTHQSTFYMHNPRQKACQERHAFMLKPDLCLCVDCIFHTDPPVWCYVLTWHLSQCASHWVPEIFSQQPQVRSAYLQPRGRGRQQTANHRWWWRGGTQLGRIKKNSQNKITKVVENQKLMAAVKVCRSVFLLIP